MSRPFLDRFEYEVFISYARSNNVPLTELGHGWVSELKSQLERILYSRLPGTRVFLDDSSLRGSQSPNDCTEIASNSATFVAIVSPIYLTRDFCNHERAAFVEANDDAAIFCVFLDDVHVHQRPAEMQKIGYDFQDRDSINPRTRFPISLHCEAGRKQLYRLAGDIEFSLQQLKDSEVSVSTHALVESSAVVVDIGRLPSGESEFEGRESEILELCGLVVDARTPVMEIASKGGEGKTSLLVKFVDQCSSTGWKRFRRVFAWSFYNQGIGDTEASSDQFFSEAFHFFGVTEPIPVSQYEKGRLLASVLADSAGLLILDGVEPLQIPPGPDGGSLTDPGIRVLLRSLAVSPLRNAAAIITTRAEVADLYDLHGSSVKQIGLKPLGDFAARRLLRKRGVAGTDPELDELATSLHRHALSLRLAGSYIREALDGDPSPWKEENLVSQDESEGGHAYRILRAYETWLCKPCATQPNTSLQMMELLRLFGLFDRPVRRNLILRLLDQDCQCELTELNVGISESVFRTLVTKLMDLGLVFDVGGTRETLDCHPIIRQYLRQSLGKFSRGAYRKLHTTVFQYLQEIAPELPENSVENAPLFQAVRHGLLAGKYQASLAVYERRINHSSASYVWLRLGQYADVLNCMSHFVRRFPDVPLPALERTEQRLVMNQLGCALMAAGRPRVAIKALVKNVQINLEDDRDGSSAATNLNNAAECLFFLGVPTALLHFSAHAAAAIERVILQGRAANIRKEEIPWGTGLNARLLYGIGLGQAGLFDDSLRSLDVTEAWFRTCYSNANDLYVTQLRYWRSHLVANCLHGLETIPRALVRLAKRLLDQDVSSEAFHQQGDFGPFDQGVFHLSRAELRLAVEIATAENRISPEAGGMLSDSGSNEIMTDAIHSDLCEAERQIGLNANRLWMGLVQTRQMQLARLRVMLGLTSSGNLDIEATTKDVLVLSAREGLRLHATDALLENAHLDGCWVTSRWWRSV